MSTILVILTGLAFAIIGIILNCFTIGEWVNYIKPSQISLDETEMANLVALQFEVFGRVQGVFFRKFTVKKGKELGLRGWCRNTDEGTVFGEIEGIVDKVNEMKNWLRTTGSPQSKITKAEFRNERQITEYSMTGFDVKR